MLGTFEHVPLGCLGALDGWWCSELNHCGVKLRASVEVSHLVVEIAPSNLTGSGDRPQGLPKCTGSVTAPKGRHLYGFCDRPQGSLSGITASCIVRGREEITVALVASWGALCLHTAPNGDYHPQGCELRDTSSSPRASVISYPSPLLMHFTL